MDGLEAAQKMYGGPPSGDGTATEPPAPESNAAERYREHLRRRFGRSEAGGVPEAVVSAFAEAHRLGREYPDQIEALATGLRAGATEKQRERAAGGAGRR